MVELVVGMIIVVALAVWVIYQAAYRPIRQGSQLLTPEGERRTRGARMRARTAASSARRAVDIRPAARSGRAATGTEAADVPAVDAVEAETASPATGPAVTAEPTSSEAAKPPAPPRQQGSPVATPATGVSGTIAR